MPPMASSTLILCLELVQYLHKEHIGPQMGSTATRNSTFDTELPCRQNQSSSPTTNRDSSRMQHMERPTKRKYSACSVAFAPSNRTTGLKAKLHTRQLLTP